jgi:hypothetical protein
MTTYVCKPYHSLRDGQTVTIVASDGVPYDLDIESATDAARVWSFREARKMYGWRGYCMSVRIQHVQEVHRGRLISFDVWLARRGKIGERHEAVSDTVVVYAVD